MRTITRRGYRLGPKGLIVTDDPIEFSYPVRTRGPWVHALYIVTANGVLFIPGVDLSPAQRRLLT